MEYNVLQKYAMSDGAILEMLGSFIQKTRLNQNKSQQMVADAAGINRTTLVQMEKGKSVTMLSFIQVLRVLEQLHILDVFELKQEISPLLLAEMEMKKRQRASKQSAKLKPYKSTW